jgi:GTP-binding protein
MTHSSVCNTCRVHLKNRLRSRILLLQSQRSSSYTTPALSADITTPENSWSWYWDTVPPTPKDLASATTFFRTYLPRKLWTATEWRKQNEPVGGTLVPEVAFLGRSNVGKSSLLNALLLSPKLNHVGPRPGKTTTMHAWGLAASDPLTGGALRGHKGDTSIKIAVLDMPGYGHASHGDWGQEIITYLKRRKQLKRVFILLDALHGVKLSDLRMLDLLRKRAISHQVIASKFDRLGKENVTQTALTEALWKMRNAAQPKSRAGGFVGLGEVLAVGSLGDGRKNENVSDKTMMGIEEVRYAVLKAAGLESTNIPHVVIPAIEGKQLPLFRGWKSSTDLTEDEAIASTQMPPARYPSAGGPEGKGDEPLTPTDTVSRRYNVDDTITAADAVRSATFEPFASGYPSSNRHRPPEPTPEPLYQSPKQLIRMKKVEPALPTHKIKVTLAIDKVHKAIPELPSTSAQERPYAGSIGYGLRDLYEMTATKPNSGNNRKRVMTHLMLEGQGTSVHRRRSKLTKFNAKRQQRQRRDAS